MGAPRTGDDAAVVGRSVADGSHPTGPAQASDRQGSKRSRRADFTFTSLILVQPRLSQQQKCSNAIRRAAAPDFFFQAIARSAI